jgi:hypothetical protein
MPKRFTETKKWDDPWFEELPSKYKLFWLYLLDECDHAGVWKVNFRKASFMIGESLEQSEVLRYLSGRVTKIDENYWIVNKFIEFQYNGLKNDKVGNSIRQILAKHRLTNLLNVLELGATKPLDSPYQGAKDKDKDKDKVMDKDKVKDKDTESELLNKKSVPNKFDPEFESVWDMYGRKGSKKQAYVEWKNLTKEDKQILIDHIPRYVEAHEAEPQYMKDFERYLKHQTYHSVIIERLRKNIFSGSI